MVRCSNSVYHDERYQKRQMDQSEGSRVPCISAADYVSIEEKCGFKLSCFCSIGSLKRKLYLQVTQPEATAQKTDNSVFQVLIMK